MSGLVGSNFSDAAQWLSQRLQDQGRAGSLQRPETPGAQAQPAVHVVKSGQLLSDLAQQYRVQSGAIVSANPQFIQDPERPLTEGDRLSIPRDHVLRLEPHTVAHGQSLASLAEEHGVELSQLARDNGLAADARLDRDQVILMPTPLGRGAANDDADGAQPSIEQEFLDALDVLDQDFDVFDTARQGDPDKADGKVSMNDLRVVAENADGRFTAEQVQAAEFLLRSDAYRSLLDTGSGRGFVDGTISRTDVDHVVERVAEGGHYADLLDTAAGRGWRDGNIGDRDIAALLADPGVPQELKDAVSLLLTGDGDSDLLHSILAGMSAPDIVAVSDLLRAVEASGLNAEQRELLAEALRLAGASSDACSELAGIISGDGIDVDELTGQLFEFMLLNSPEFAALDPEQQELVVAALDDASDPGVAASILSLIRSDEFSGLSGAEKTAVLTQVESYSNSSSIQNIERVLQTQWFQDHTRLDDMERSLEMIARLSERAESHRADPDLDPTVMDNTLDLLLDPDTEIELVWADKGEFNSEWTYGTANWSDQRITLNRDMFDDPDYQDHLVLHTVAHEVAHINRETNYTTEYERMQEEYRAWYVGFIAEHGRPPTNEEAMERLQLFMNPNVSYYDSFTKGILADDEQREQFHEFVSELTGLDVDDSNFAEVMGRREITITVPGLGAEVTIEATEPMDSSGWANEPDGEAPEPDVPPGNSLDNS